MGVFGRSLPTTTFLINLKPLSNKEIINSVISDFTEYLDSMSREISEHTDLLNIRDSMRGEVNKLKYLLTLE